jgi:hypothetical protein
VLPYVCLAVVVATYRARRVPTGTSFTTRCSGWEQPVLIAVPVFEVEVEQLGVDVVYQLDGDGGVEGDLPTVRREWGPMRADGPRALAAMVGLGIVGGLQSQARAERCGGAVVGLGEGPSLVAGEGPDGAWSTAPGPVRFRGRTFTLWAGSKLSKGWVIRAGLLLGGCETQGLVV